MIDTLNTFFGLRTYRRYFLKTKNKEIAIRKEIDLFLFSHPI